MLKIAGYTLVSRVLGAALSFSIIIVLSRFLGPAERGICSLYILIVSISCIISEMAGGAASAFLLKIFSAKYLQQVQLLWSLFPSVMIPLIFLVFNAINTSDLLIIILACWANSAMVMQQHLFLGLQKFLILNVFHLLLPGLTLATFLLFVNFKQNRFSFYYATLISWFLIFCVGYYLLRFRYRDVYFKHSGSSLNFLEIFKAGSVNQIGHLVSIFNSRLIFFILPAFQLGIWSNTLSLAEGLFLVAGSLGQVLYGKILNNKSGDELNNKWFRMAFIVNLLLTTILAMGMVLIPDSGWIWLFGNGFEGISKMVGGLFIGIIFQSIFLLTTYRLSAEGLFSKNLYALIWGGGVNLFITLMLLFFEKYSLNGGILALSIGWATAAIAAFFYLKKEKPAIFMASKINRK